MTTNPAPVLASNTTSAPSMGSIAANGTQLIAQSFVGTAGELQSVAISASFMGSSQATPTVAIYELAGTTLGSQIAQAQVPTPDVLWSTPVPFGSGVQLAAGQSYAIVVTYPQATESDTFTWAAKDGALAGSTCLRGPANGIGLSVVESSVCDFSVMVAVNVAPSFGATLGAVSSKSGLGAGKGINSTTD